MAGTVSKTQQWQNHLAKFRREHPELTYKQALKEASKTYKRSKDPTPTQRPSPPPSVQRIKAEKLNRDLLKNKVEYDDLSGKDFEMYTQHFWGNMTTYKALIDTNIRFLKGELYMTPYHLGPIDVLTQKTVKNFIKINRAGFFTIDSQPNDVKGLTSYVHAFFPKNRVNKLIKFMASRPFINTWVADIHPFKVRFNNHHAKGWSAYWYVVRKRTQEIGYERDPLPKSGDETAIISFSKRPYLGRTTQTLRDTCAFVVMSGDYHRNADVETALLDFIIYEQRDA